MRPTIRVRVRFRVRFKVRVRVRVRIMAPFDLSVKISPACQKFSLQRAKLKRNHIRSHVGDWFVGDRCVVGRGKESGEWGEAVWVESAIQEPG